MLFWNWGAEVICANLQFRTSLFFCLCCKSQHSKCPQKKSKVNARSRIEKIFHAEIWWVWLCFYIFLECCFFSPMKTHLITGCHQLDSHYRVFCVVVSNVFGGIGFVLFVSFFFLLLFCFFILMQLICPCEIWFVVKDWAVHWNVHLSLCFWSCLCIHFTRDIVLVPYNSPSTHFLSEPN